MIVEKLLRDREAAAARADWGLVREIDAYLERLGYRDGEPVVETADQSVLPEDTAGPRPVRNSRR